MLYLNEGLSFEKQPDGGVRIVKRSGNTEESPVIFDHVLDATEWASVSAAMGASGEEVAKFTEGPIPILD
jgi:hypothetical protein